MYGLFWKCDFPQPAEIKRDDFVNGWLSLNVANLSEMKAKCVELKRELATKKHFAPFYTWCFDFNLEDQDKKYIDTEPAQEVYIPRYIYSHESHL